MSEFVRIYSYVIRMLVINSVSREKIILVGATVFSLTACTDGGSGGNGGNAGLQVQGGNGCNGGFGAQEVRGLLRGDFLIS